VNGFRWTIWILTLMVFLWGCDKSGPVATNGEQPPAVTVEKTSPVPEETSTEEPLQVEILPLEPTAESTLHARVSGTREPVIYRWLKNGQILEGEETASLAAKSFVKGDIIEADVISGTMSALATVVIRNSPPVISGVNYSYGSEFTVEPQGEDADGDSISYRYEWLVNGEEVPMQTGSDLPGEFFSQGDRVGVVVTPYDEESDGLAFRLEGVQIENKPPVITSTPPTETEGNDFTYQVVAEDPEGEGLTYSLEAAPLGMTIDPQAGKVHWAIDASAAGTQEIKIKVEDASGRWTVQEFTLKTHEKSVE